MLTFVVGIVRGLFSLIDRVVVWLIENLYNLIIEISSIEIFGPNEIGSFASRISVVLGIFMLFKLSFSFLTYIMNPDQFTDKSKGFSKLIQNVAVALVLLTSYQFIFSKAMDFQYALLKNNTIPKLIFGTGNEGSNVDFNDAGKSLTFYTFSVFVPPNSLIPECKGYAYNLTNECLNSNNLKKYTDNIVPIEGVLNLPNEQLKYVVQNKNTYMLLNNLLSLKDGDTFLFDYKIVISLVAGVVVALILLSFTMDIATRTIKLAFLELIAPIPILYYIDPNKGESVFKKWLSVVGKTYADLFIRLIAIFFAIYVISIVNDIKLFDGTEASIFARLFVIIGALMFAKQFPKLIQEITGISLDGKMQLNPFKKVSEEALGGKQLVGAAAGVGAAALAGGTNFLHRAGQTIGNVRNTQGFGNRLREAGRGTLRTIGSSIGGAASAGRRAFSHGAKGDGFAKSLWQGDQEAMFAKLQREDLNRQGSTMGGRLKADLSRYAGVLNAGQKQILRAGELDNQVNGLKNQIKVSKDNMARIKEQNLSDLQQYSTLIEALEKQVDNNGEVKGAKSKYDAIASTNGRTLIDQAQIKHDARINTAANKLKVSESKLAGIREYSTEEITSANNEVTFEQSNYSKATNELKAAQIKLEAAEKSKKLDETYKARINYETKLNEVEQAKAKVEAAQQKQLKIQDDIKIRNDIQEEIKKERINYQNEQIAAKQELDNTVEYVNSGKALSDAFNEFKETRSKVGNEMLQNDPNAIAIKERAKVIKQRIDSNTHLTTEQKQFVSDLSGDDAFSKATDSRKAIDNYTSAFELTNAEYLAEKSNIESLERQVETIEASDEYIDTHNTKSPERTNNASRNVKGPQPEGWTPNPDYVDPRTYMPGSLGGNNPQGVINSPDGNPGGPGTPPPGRHGHP